MSRRGALEIFDFAIEHGCKIEYGGKHVKIMSPKGLLLGVVSNSRVKEYGGVDQMKRSLLRKIQSEKANGSSNNS